MSLNTFAYDGQIRRFLLQFIRIMSHFQVEFGKNEAGIAALQQVPVFYGDSTRQVAQILKGNSENGLPTVPCMACYIAALTYDRSRVQEPTHVGKLQIRQRNYDHSSNTWGSAQGEAFTVERMMPAPYNITLKVDIWTSNTEQKLQLKEQMLPLFNPGMEIQSTDNYIDWTSLSIIWLKDVNWSSRQVPMGADDQIDVATLTFELPIWLSLPAKVKQMGVIQKIIASIYDAEGNIINEVADLPTAAMSRIVITPMNYGVVFFDNVLRLTRETDLVTETVDSVTVSLNDVYSWDTLAHMYNGVIQNGVTQVRLEQSNGSVVVGTVALHPTDSRALLFSPIQDTIPANTLPPVNAIIDPFNVPVDTSFLGAAVGTRYLILNDIGSIENVDAALAWHGADGSDLVAKANDVIEFDGTRWYVAFAAASSTNSKYLTNLKTGLQFKWTPETQMWTKSIEGEYQAGEWTLVL